MTTAECRGFKPATGDGFAIHPYSGRTRARARAPATPTTSAWRRSATCRPRSTGSSAPARCGPRRPASRSSSTSTATRPARPTGSPGSSRDGRTPGSSGRPTWPGARRGSGSSRSTCGATSRAARTARSAAGSPACASRGGRAKPSLAHFDTPFVLDAAQPRLWGQVRPGGAHTVTIERKPNGGAWTTLAATRTDGRGYWALRRPLARTSSYRYRADGRRSATLRP